MEGEIGQRGLYERRVTQDALRQIPRLDLASDCRTRDSTGPDVGRRVRTPVSAAWALNLLGLSRLRYLFQPLCAILRSSEGGAPATWDSTPP